MTAFSGEEIRGFPAVLGAVARWAPVASPCCRSLMVAVVLAVKPLDNIYSIFPSLYAHEVEIPEVHFGLQRRDVKLQ